MHWILRYHTYNYNRRKMSIFLLSIIFYSSLLAGAGVVSAEQRRKKMEGQRVTFYVGTYTDKGVESDGIYAFELLVSQDFTDFSYAKIGSTHVINPSFLTVTNDKKHLIAVSETADAEESKVHSYRITANGNLDHISSLPSEGTFTCYVSTDSRDKFVYISSYFGGTALAYGIDSQGVLTKKSKVTYTGSAGVDPERQEAPHVHSIQTGPKDYYVYAADLGNDRIVRMKYDAQKGFDETSSAFFSSEPGAGPRHFVFHPNGRFLYLSTELSNTVHVFEVNQTDGALKLVQVISSLPDTFTDTSLIAEIKMSSNGKFVYVANRGHDSIAIFSVSDDGSKLASVGFAPSKGKFPRNFDLLEDLMIVANQDTDDLAVFKINPDGSLVNIGQMIPCPKPVRVKIVQQPQ